DFAILPRQLTAYPRRLLEQGRSLVEQLRNLANEFNTSLDGVDPLAERYHQTAAMADSTLRMIQAFPDAPSAQLRLCEGLAAMLEVVADSVAGISAAVTERRRETQQVETLAGLLSALSAGQSIDIKRVVELGEIILAEAQQAAPLRFLTASAEQPARFIASHS